MIKGIFKRKNSKYFWIMYAGVDGRMLRESSRSTKLRDAEALLHKRKASVLEGKQPEIQKPIKNHSFFQLAEEYKEWMQRQRSFKSKSNLVKQLVSKYGNLPLRRFNMMLLEQFQTERLDKGNKPATINRFIATIKHMFTKAVDWNMVEENILKSVRRVKLLEEKNRRLRFLSKDECQELVKHCSPYMKPIVIMALNTGMRKGEILTLKWSNVDMKHRFILLENTKNGERREIPINGTLADAVSGLARRIDDGYVFYDPKTDKPYQCIKKGFATALRKAGIQDFHFHDLRHTFASHLVMAGVDITTIKELLGHKSLTMTMRYAHLAPSHKVNAVGILDNAINGNGNAADDSTAHLLHTSGVQGKLGAV